MALKIIIRCLIALMCMKVNCDSADNGQMTHCCSSEFTALQMLFKCVYVFNSLHRVLSLHCVQMSDTLLEVLVKVYEMHSRRKWE